MCVKVCGSRAPACGVSRTTRARTHARTHTHTHTGIDGDDISRLVRCITTHDLNSLVTGVLFTQCVVGLYIVCMCVRVRLRVF